MQRTFTDCIMIFAAQPRGDCFLPLPPCAHWVAISSVVPNNFKLTAGAAAPLERFGNKLQNRPQTPDGFAHLRSASRLLPRMLLANNISRLTAALICYRLQAEYFCYSVKFAYAPCLGGAASPVVRIVSVGYFRQLSRTAVIEIVRT